MILSISNIKKIFISIMQDFMDFVGSNNLECEVIVTDNHPYLSKYTLKKQNLLVIRFDNFQELHNHTSRSGVFFKNVNEYNFNIEIFFMAFVESKKYDANDRMLDLYALFSDFLYENNHSFVNIIEKDDKYNVYVKYYIHNTSNMLNSGLLNINSNYTQGCYVCSNNFTITVKCVEQLKQDVKLQIQEKIRREYA